MALRTINPTSNTTPDPGQGGAVVATNTNTGHASTTVIAGATELRTCIWTAFRDTGGGKQAINLKFDWQADGAVDGGTNQFLVQYSVNGGSNWTDAVNQVDVAGATGAQAFSVGLSVTQTISQVQVRDKLAASTGTATLTAQISNIRLEVTTQDHQVVGMM